MVVLGELRISALDMASAYATYASGGTFCSPQAITEVVDRNGDPMEIIVEPALQAQGMGAGLFYWLAQDANGRFLPTPGRRHRKVYISNGPAGMTKAAIATHAGVTASPHWRMPSTNPSYFCMPLYRRRSPLIKPIRRCPLLWR